MVLNRWVLTQNVTAEKKTMLNAKNKMQLTYKSFMQTAIEMRNDEKTFPYATGQRLKEVSSAPRLHLFVKKYSKNSNIVKYYCNLK